MTRDEIVKQITDANTELVFALLSSWVPVLKIPMLSWVVKYYISKGLRPEVNEGVVLAYFKIVDWEQLDKASTFGVAMTKLSAAVQGGNDRDIEIASDNFDNAFRDSIGLHP